MSQHNAELMAERAKIPDGYQEVPIELLKRSSDSLGSFCSDHDWTDEDMDVMDAIDSWIAMGEKTE